MPRSKIRTLSLEFVTNIPETIQDGKLYVSIPYATVIHNCACGCKSEVVTPLSPIDWQLVFDGETITLDPSVGNWNFACESHYLIVKNQIVWAPRWSKNRIEANRQDYRTLRDYAYSSHGKRDQAHLTSRPSKWKTLRSWLTRR